MIQRAGDVLAAFSVGLMVVLMLSVAGVFSESVMFSTYALIFKVLPLLCLLWVGALLVPGVVANAWNRVKEWD